jgi:diguanylate cyclase
LPVPPSPPDEDKRRESLARLEVLDSPPEAEFDALVRAAALVCGVPISLVSLVDRDRQWFKANTGLPGVTETPRELAFCAHTIMQDDLFEVPDATLDARFSANALVTADPKIRFYAGATLCLSDGAHVGTLCVIDREPRQLSSTQREILRHLALATVAALEGRRAVLDFAESEARLRTLTQAAPDAIITADRSQRVVLFNRAAEKMFLCDAQDALGQPLERFIPERFRHEHSVHVEQFGREENTHRAMHSQRRLFALRGDGTEFPIEAAISRAIVHGEPLFTVILRDISGRVQLESAVAIRSEQLNQAHQELRIVSDQLKAAQRITNTGSWRYDLASGLVTWSEELFRIVRREQSAGVVPYEEQHQIYTPGSWQRLSAAVTACVETGTPYELELQMRGQPDELRWAMARGEALRGSTGKIEQLVGTLQDITERVKQRQALEDAHQRVSLATDSGGIGIWQYDLTTRRGVWDAWMNRLYGRPPSTAEVTYQSWIEQIHPEDRGATEKAMKGAAAGAAPFDTEFRIAWHDSSVHHIRASGQITRDQLGKPVRMVGVCWDVSAMRKLTAELQEQHELLRVTLQSIGDAVITTDARGHVTWLNPVAERMTGWRAEEARGLPLERAFQIVNEQTRTPSENPVKACLRDGKVVGLANHTVLLSRDGCEYSIEDSAAPIRNEREEVLGVVLVFHDVTEQRRISGEMSHRATHDALTGLVNRGEFEARLRQALRNAHEEASEHSLMYLDLDQFKLVNDACGHAAGDQLLQQVSKILADTVRGSDTLARLGGDEFGVILTHCTREQAQRVAEKICQRMDAYRFVRDGRPFRIGASIGLVPLDARWSTTAAIMQAADTVCYAAKEAGRNRVHTWVESDASMRARNSEMRWATRLSQALDEERFMLFAQRIEALGASPQGLHFEVLLRMLDEDGKLVLPGSFLPAAERFHLSSRLDRWVLKQSLVQLLSLRDLSAVDTMSVNLSGQSIGDRAFHRDAIEMLKAAGTTVCQRVCLEITETAAVTNMADASLFINQVRSLGVRIALDDFGAGASSFGYLKTLTVDLLKIDGQYIKDLLSEPLHDVTVRCFVDVARVVGVKTVAEFVDKPAVLARVREIGIDYAQGFLLHRPEPIELVLEQIAKAPEAGAEERRASG